ncbi:MAG: fluoride efflux transporter CrcB [Calditrichaeota bacterium]|nr:MAG: fluoride efflux transporter CrcB [Calditrichota bacterium]
MTQLIIIGAGGFIGAILRYSLSGLVHRFTGSGLPYGTLAVNVLGSFILGFFLYISEQKLAIDPLWRSFIAVGMMGALTTFSTFSWETWQMISSGLWLHALGNITLNILCTLTAVWAGIFLARAL